MQAAKALVVAEILSVDPHPKADRLHLVTLDAGGSGTVKVRVLGRSSGVRWGTSEAARQPAIVKMFKLLVLEEPRAGQRWVMCGAQL